MLKLFSIFCGLIAFVNLAQAAQTPRPGSLDGRIRSVTYQKDNVVKVYGTHGTSTMLVFSNDETFETIAVGDSASWEVIPSGSNNILFVKPIAENVRTNMNIVTNRRIYHFDLVDNAPEAGKHTFAIRFVYPGEKVNAAIVKEAEERVKFPNISKIEKENINLDYSFTGDGNFKPLKIFDDGNKTFIEFPKNKVPSIFTVNDDLSETLVNFRREGEYIVVDGEHTQLTLRDGDEFVCLFNLRKPDFGVAPKGETGPKPQNPKRKKRRFVANER